MDTNLDARDVHSNSQEGASGLAADALEEIFSQTQARPGAPTFGSRGAAGRAVHQANAAHNPVKYEPGKAIDKISYTHDAMIDAIIEQPRISEASLAAVFGYTPGWISQIISSDAFKARLEQRKDELVDPRLRMTLNEKFQALVNKSLDVLSEKLAMPSVDPELALQAAALGAKALGLGGNRAPVILQPSSDRLTLLAQRLEGLMPAAPYGEVLDVQAKQIRASAEG